MKNFQRGQRPTFKCAICKHNTRHTGVQGGDSELCPDCWELAGYENQLSDYGAEEFAKDVPTVLRYIAAIEKKGGDASDWRQTFAKVLAPKTDATGMPMVDGPFTTISDEDKILNLLMSRSTSELDRADIQRLTQLGEETCYRILRKLVADGRVTQRMHTGKRDAGWQRSLPVRVARYSIAQVRTISVGA